MNPPSLRDTPSDESEVGTRSTGSAILLMMDPPADDATFAEASAPKVEGVPTFCSRENRFR